MSGDYNQVLDDIELDMDIETIKLDDIELEEIDSEMPSVLDSQENNSDQENSAETIETIEDSSLKTDETLDIIEDSPEPAVPSPTGEEIDNDVPILDLSDNQEESLDASIDLDSDTISLDSDITIPDSMDTNIENSDTETTNPTETDPSTIQENINEQESKPEAVSSSTELFGEDDDIISIDGRDLDRIIYGEEETQSVEASESDKIDEVPVIKEDDSSTEEVSFASDETKEPENLVEIQEVEQAETDESALQHENFELSVEPEPLGESNVQLSNEPTEVLSNEETETESPNTEASLDSFDFDLSVIPDVEEVDEDEPISLSMDELNNIDISDSSDPQEIENSSSIPLSQEEPDLDSLQVEEADEIELPLPDEPAVTEEIPTVQEDESEEIELSSTDEPAVTEEIPSSQEAESEKIELSSTDEPAITEEIPTVQEDESEKIEISPTDEPAITEEIPTVQEAESEEIEIEIPQEEIALIDQKAILVKEPKEEKEEESSAAVLEEEIPITQSDFDEISSIEMKDDEPDLTESDLEVMIKEPEIPQAAEPELAENEEHLEIAIEELDEIQSNIQEEKPVPSEVYQMESEDEQKSHRELIEEKMEGLSEETREELKTVLKYLDDLLEDLPEEKIKEFSESKYYDLYVKILDKLGV